MARGKKLCFLPDNSSFFKAFPPPKKKKKKYFHLLNEPKNEKKSVWGRASEEHSVVFGELPACSQFPALTQQNPCGVIVVFIRACLDAGCLPAARATAWPPPWRWVAPPTTAAHPATSPAPATPLEAPLTGDRSPCPSSKRDPANLRPQGFNSLSSIFF